VLEYAELGSLYHQLHEVDTPLQYEVRARLMVQLISAVAFLHGLNIIHRDLKSLNCVLTKGRLRVGLACVLRGCVRVCGCVLFGCYKTGVCICLLLPCLCVVWHCSLLVGRFLVFIHCVLFSSDALRCLSLSLFLSLELSLELSVSLFLSLLGVYVCLFVCEWLSLCLSLCISVL
jgi:serine/threonine protein kinase